MYVCIYVCVYVHIFPVTPSEAQGQLKDFFVSFYDVRQYSLDELSARRKASEGFQPAMQCTNA
jgi:hypothetical protein